MCVCDCKRNCALEELIKKAVNHLLLQSCTEKKNHPKTISSLTSPDFVLKEQKKHFLNILKSLKCKPDLNAVLLFLGYVEIHLNDLTNAGLFSTQAVSSSYTEPHLDKGAAQYKCRRVTRSRGAVEG